MHIAKVALTKSELEASYKSSFFVFIILHAWKYLLSGIPTLKKTFIRLKWYKGELQDLYLIITTVPTAL